MHVTYAHDSRGPCALRRRAHLPPVDKPALLKPRVARGLRSAGLDWDFAAEGSKWRRHSKDDTRASGAKAVVHGSSFRRIADRQSGPSAHLDGSIDMHAGKSKPAKQDGLSFGDRCPPGIRLAPDRSYACSEYRQRPWPVRASRSSPSKPCARDSACRARTGKPLIDRASKRQRKSVSFHAERMRQEPFQS
ncbi:hypothetical protein SAMN05192539_1003186 [Paraburkholderia diazotrophica]|uniref:Uncharacterized protein n=1 Tax=Paraburkholderia diazotrophica TaxID=667676 RepID=A0A1H6SQB2_9BURK|nr:hypothetical protein SAMN05192539_1003186 [Paraburkholderia diazotrophica]